MDQFLEFHLARPPKLPPGFGGIPQQRFHIGRPEELGIDDHMVVVVQAQVEKAVSTNSRTECCSPVAIT